MSATVPAGANTVAISLFRLNSVIKRTGKARQKPSSVHIATVYRKAPKAKRYVFRLTEKPFRHLKPGRYLVQVRVGTVADGPRAGGEPADHDPEGEVQQRPVGPPTRGAEPIGAAGPCG